MLPRKSDRTSLLHRSAPRLKRRARKPLGLGTLVKFTVFAVGFMVASDLIFYGRIGPEPRPRSALPGPSPPVAAPAPAPRIEPESAVPSSPGEANPDFELIRNLPTLSASTATPELVERAKELALRNPDIPWLRQYVANAHLWVATALSTQRRFEEAERILDEAQAWGASPGYVAACKAMLYRYQQSWPTAARWAREALRLGSEMNPGEMHFILGKDHYFRQELARAIEEYEEALSLGERPEIRAALEEALRDSRTARGYDQKRLSHFIVTYEGETMEGTGRMAIDTLERAHASLVSDLGFSPSDPVGVVLYTRHSYREYDGPHYGGGKFDGKIRLPVKDVPWGDAHINKILRHELAHAFFHAATGQQHEPRWLNEGLAEYAAGVRARDVQQTVAPHLAGGGTLEHCLTQTLYDCPMFYPAATSLVNYLIEVRGMGGIRDILSGLGEGEDIDHALRRTAGETESSLIEDWERFVRRR
jgi:tetratricopeptide (TPR) repeat protein